jgi:hypothetical protein
VFPDSVYGVMSRVGDRIRNLLNQCADVEEKAVWGDTAFKQAVAGKESYVVLLHITVAGKVKIYYSS